MGNATKPGFGRVALGIALCMGAVASIAALDRGEKPIPVPQPAKTFSLIHTLGNTENVSATGLSQGECERRKADLKIVGQSLGSYDEKTRYGSIVCLSEPLYQ